MAAFATSAVALVLAMAASASADASVPPQFDCEMRHLAMEYAFKIQPFREQAEFKKMADALNLPGGAPGGATQCFNTTAPANAPTSFDPHFPIPSGATPVFVDYEKGNDGNSGTMSSPVKTIAHAVEITRGQNATAKAVVLRAGVHYVTDTLMLDARDNFLTIMSYNGEDAIVSGGQRLSGSWTASKSIPNAWEMDLSSMHLDDISGLRINRRRAVRARYPNGCSSTDPLPSKYLCQGFSTGGEVVNPLQGFGSNALAKSWVQPTDPTMNQPNWTQYVASDPDLNRSSGASFQQYQIGVGGSCSIFTPPAGYWCGNQCAGGAPKPPGCIFRTPRGLEYDANTLPNAPYKDSSRAVVQVWHPGHWASWAFDVASTNETHIMFNTGGFQGARGNDHGEAFFVENVIEELDMNNEFFYDPATKTLYYFYNTSSAPQGTVEVTQLKTIISVEGSLSNPVRDIRLLGLEFNDAAMTLMDEHGMPSGGDWGLGRTAAVYMSGVDSPVIDSCTFRQLDGNALLLYGYARDAQIINNKWTEIGDNMIALWGKTVGAPSGAMDMGWDGRNGDQPRYTTIANNLAYNPGLFEKQSSFFFQAKSGFNTLRNNIFYNGPRAGINFNDGFGGGSLLEGNLLFNTVRESGDHGPFNSWNRQPFAAENKPDGTPNVDKRIDVIRNNYIIGNYYGQEAIDNDDGSSYYSTHHNVFFYAATGMKNDFTGHDNDHHSNLYGFISRGTGIGPVLPGHADQFYNNKVVLINSNGYLSYDCNCNATNTCPTFKENAVYTPDGTMGSICGKSLADLQAEGLDVGTRVLPWPSVDDFVLWARELLDMPS